MKRLRREKRREEEKIREEKHIYGKYKKVRLTEDEHKNLTVKFGENVRYAWIRKLDEGIELKGYKYKSHYLAILKWAEKDGGAFDF